MRSLFLALASLPLWSCQLIAPAHGDPPIELDLDTGESPEPVAQPHSWPVQTRIDTQTGRFELTWTAEPIESIPLEAIHQLELARAWKDFPDELFLHLVNSRRILISRGDQVATQVAVLSTWLERPVVVLPAGEGHREWEGILDRPDPQLTVDTAGGMLDIQPIEADSPSSGRTPGEEFDRTIKAQMPRFRSCYHRQLRLNPSLEGRILMQITIAPDGHVSSAVLVDSSMDDPVVEACISAELLRVEIAPREDELVIQYPFAFSSS